MKWLHKEFWLQASPKETIEIFERIAKSKTFKGWNAFLEKHDDLADLVFEYVWLYRSELSVRNFLNHVDFPSWLLLRFVYFGFGKQFLLGKFDTGEYYSELRSLLGSETSLRILSLGTELERDPTLKIHLLANLDPSTWESYFDMIDGQAMTMDALLGIFTNLKEQEIRKILLQSPTLYMYLRMMMISGAKSESLETGSEKFRLALSEILESIHKWEKFTLDIKGLFELKNEINLPPRKRNQNRISKILHALKALLQEEQQEILSYFKATGIVMDDWEYSLVSSSLENFRKKNSFF